jgi:tetratricopeptide (TPR) repeat protein
MGMALRRWIAIALFLALTTSAAWPQQTKTIKDPAEYNAYIAALNLSNPVQKAAAMEAFAARYPKSVVRIDALEQAMAAYQQAGNAPKVEASAERILHIEPNNVRALAIVAFLKRSAAAQGNAAAVAASAAAAERGLKALPHWAKPNGMNNAEFKKLHNQMTAIFEGAAGFAALQAKDYAKARDHYRKSIAIDPNSMQDVYQLAVAELEMTPLDADGFWHVARALKLSAGNAAAQQSIARYGKAKYKKYHGGEDGWDAIVAQAAKTANVPAGFAQSIKAAPTPAELAVNAVRDNDPKSLSFGDWEYILGYRDASPANKDAADKVWNAIQALQKNGAVKLKISVKLIRADATTLDVAITDDNQKSNTADMRVMLAKPLAALPAAGAMVDVTGVITGYTPKPFVFQITNGEVAAK